MPKKTIKVRVRDERVYPCSVGYTLEILGMNIVCSPDDMIDCIAREIGIPLGERIGMEFSINVRTRRYERSR